MSFTSQQAPQSNPPITPFYYQPSLFQITNVTRGQTTLITMANNTTGGESVSPNYEIGQLVRFHIPKAYGIQELNRRQAYVLSIPSANEVVVDIDSSQFNSFILSPSYSPNIPQICGIGDVNSGNINTTGITNQNTNVIGSFINISNPTNIT